MVLKNLQGVIRDIEGSILYRISGLNLLGEPDEATAIEVLNKRGPTSAIPSRVETDKTLKGSKRTIVRQGNVYIGKGRKDDRSILVVPLLSSAPARPNSIEHLLLLHINFKDTVPLNVKMRASAANTSTSATSSRKTASAGATTCWSSSPSTSSSGGQRKKWANSSWPRQGIGNGARRRNFFSEPVPGPWPDSKGMVFSIRPCYEKGMRQRPAPAAASGNRPALDHPSEILIRQAMKQYNLLLVDDDPIILEGLGEDLENRGYLVTRASSGDRAMELLHRSDFDLVITDLVMEKTDGIQVLKRSKEIDATIMVIVLTGFGDMLSAIEALRNQADDYMLKPCESAEMFFRVERCLEKLELARRISLYQKILPMCCVCKKIRDDTGREPGRGPWVPVEQFIHEQAQLDITSSYCPECAQRTLQQFIKKVTLRRVNPGGPLGLLPFGGAHDASKHHPALAALVTWALLMFSAAPVIRNQSSGRSSRA